MSSAVGKHACHLHNSSSDKDGRDPTRFDGTPLCCNKPPSTAVPHNLISHHCPLTGDDRAIRAQKNNVSARRSYLSALPACTPAPPHTQDLTRQAALRQVARRAAQRSRGVEVAAFQRWRLATATAVVEKLRQQERAGSIGRGAVVAEAALRRRDAGRVSAGFRRWKEADAEVRAQRSGLQEEKNERVVGAYIADKECLSTSVGSQENAFRLRRGTSQDMQDCCENSGRISTVVCYFCVRPPVRPPMQLLQIEIAAARARDRRTAAATATAALLHRRRRHRLRRGLQALSAAARAKAERRRRAERASLSAAMSQRAARTLLLTRCWGAWKALTAAGGLARR